VQKEDEQPLISVVTVVMNDLDGFLATKDSLAGQEFKNFEWIIIDSSDTPLSANQGERAKYSWVTPEGIFSAMNNGLKLSVAPYVYFLNAGDCLKDGEVFQKISDISLRIPLTTAIYGDVRFLDEKGSVVVPKPFSLKKEQSKLFCRGRFPPHQGTFTPAESLRSVGGFDENLIVAGDYKAFIALSKKIDYLYAPIEIATFQLGGRSSQKRKKGIWELHQARKEVFRPHGLLRLHENFYTALEFMKYFAFIGIQSVRRFSS
jgi:glycosyltransferase involved in cell wall biosynthesis